MVIGGVAVFEVSQPWSGFLGFLQYESAEPFTKSVLPACCNYDVQEEAITYNPLWADVSGGKGRAAEWLASRLTPPISGRKGRWERRRTKGYIFRKKYEKSEL
jgi:hypothetical protein